MTRIQGMTLTRRQSLLALSYAATLGPFALFGCGGGSGSSGATKGAVTSNGRVILPTGSPLKFNSVSLVSGLTPAKLSPDGSYSLQQLSGDSALLVLADASQRPLLLGFSGSTATSLVGEVSPIQTAVALIFYALGAFTLPLDAQETVRSLLTKDNRVQVLGAQLGTLLSTNPYALAESDPALLNAVTTLRDAIFQPVSRALVTRTRDQQLDATLIQTSPENEQHGYLAASNGNGLGLTITNTRRRNALASIYETAYTDGNGVRHTLAEPIFTRHQILNNEFLWGTSGLAGVIGSVVDAANGTVAFGPVSNGPYNLDMFPSDATLAEYKIVIVANGNGGDASGLLADDPTLSSAHAKVCWISFAKDVFLPALATLIGFQGALKEAFKQTVSPGTSLLKAFDDLAAILIGVVDSTVAISAGSVRTLLVTVLKAVANSGTLRQKLIEWLFVQIFPRLGPAASVSAYNILGNATNLNVLVIAIDKLMGAGDIGVVIADWARSDSYIRFDAKVIAAKVKLSPTTGDLTPGDVVNLHASTTISGAVITYHWSIISGSGTLRNPVSGLTGTSLDSSSRDLEYHSDANAISGEVITIQLEGFTGSVNDPNRKSIGKAVSKFTLKTMIDQVKIVFTSLNPGAIPLTGETRIMPVFDSPALQSYQGNPVVTELFSNLRTSGVDDAFKVSMWFDTPTVKPGAQTHYGPHMNGEIILNVVDQNRNQVRFTAASGTLTVVDVSNELLGGFLTFKLVASMKTSGGETADIVVTGGASGIVKP